MIDIITLSFTGIVFISVFFATLLQQNIYYSLLCLQPAIISFVLLAFKWIGIKENIVLLIIMVVIFLSFVTISIIFSQKYMIFHYNESVADSKNNKKKA